MKCEINVAALHAKHQPEFDFYYIERRLLKKNVAWIKFYPKPFSCAMF